MVTNVFRGDAQPIQQIQNLSINGTITATNWIQTTINRKEIRYTLTGSEANTTVVAQGLLSLLNASTIAEYREITFTQSTNIITATGPSTGKPYTMTVSNGTGNISMNSTLVQSATGPNHWDNADNWSNGTIPITGDAVVIPAGVSFKPAIYYGLDQSAVNLANMTIYNVAIGLPDDTGTYTEYRDKFLQIQCGNITMDSSGTGLVRLDLGNGTSSGAITFKVQSSPSGTQVGVPAVQIKNTHANSTMSVTKGSIGVAWNPGEVCSILTLRVGYVTSVIGDVAFYSGAGATITTVSQAGGILYLGAGITTLTMEDGIANVYTGNITTVNGRKGTLNYQASGTITTLYVGSDFTADFSQDPRTKTITNTTVYNGSTLKDPLKVVTFTNPITVSGCGLSEINLDLGTDFTLARA